MRATIGPNPLQFPASPRAHWRIRVFALDPVRRAAGTVAQVLALRHDAFQAKLALEDERAVFMLEVFIQADACRCTHAPQIAAQVIAVEVAG